MSEEPVALQIPRLSSAPSEADYDSIRAVMVETERGRWFLEEYARRNRIASTEAGLAAIQRLETALLGEGAAQFFDRFRSDMIDMAQAISHIKAEIAAIKPHPKGHGKIEDATGELDSIVQTTERAASRILAAAEQVQEIAWTLREKGADAGLCDQLDAEAIEIYTACSFQDLTGQRTRKVVQVLRYLEHRINAMIEILGKDVPAAPASEQTGGGALIDGPSPTGVGVNQADVDVMLQPGDADDRQDATIEDISRFMAALGPLMAIHQQASIAAESVAAQDHATAPATKFPAEPLLAAPTAEPPPATVSDVENTRKAVAAFEQELLEAAIPAALEAAPTPQADLDDFLFIPAPLEESDPADFLLEPATASTAPRAKPFNVPTAAPGTAMPSFENLMATARELPAADVAPAAQPPESLPTTVMGSQIFPEPAVVQEPTHPRPTLTAPSRPASIPTRTPNDPLAALRALTDEEKIALFT